MKASTRFLHVQEKSLCAGGGVMIGRDRRHYGYEKRKLLGYVSIIYFFQMSYPNIP